MLRTDRVDGVECRLQWVEEEGREERGKKLWRSGGKEEGVDELMECCLVISSAEKVYER